MNMSCAVSLPNVIMLRMYVLCPPSQYIMFFVWILSQVENLASFYLQDGATNWHNLAQLVSPSVALPAELISLSPPPLPYLQPLK